MHIPNGAWTLAPGCSLLLGLAGCGDPAGPRSPVPTPTWASANTNTSVTVSELEFTQFVPCADENVFWIGKARAVHHTTTNRGVPSELPEGVFQHSVDLEMLRLSGIGEDSGDVYRLASALHVSGHAEDPVEQFPVVFRVDLRERVSRHPGGLIGTATFTLDIRINGTGDPVIERVRDFTIACP
jgi:hypothetical protein